MTFTFFFQGSWRVFSHEISIQSNQYSVHTCMPLLWSHNQCPYHQTIREFSLGVGRGSPWYICSFCFCNVVCVCVYTIPLVNNIAFLLFCTSNQNINGCLQRESSTPHPEPLSIFSVSQAVFLMNSEVHASSLMHCFKSR